LGFGIGNFNFNEDGLRLRAQVSGLMPLPLELRGWYFGVQVSGFGVKRSPSAPERAAVCPRAPAEFSVKGVRCRV